jgi:hypothetical protein
MTITAHEFERKESEGRVCPGAPALFREAFGDRFDPTPENIRRAVEIWGAVWVAGHATHFVPPERLGRYLLAERAAYRAYMREKALIGDGPDRGAEVAALRARHADSLIEPLIEALGNRLQQSMES